VQTEFSSDILKIDAGAEVDRICEAIREHVGRRLHRRGAVIGLSGGIDSSVCGALCTRALGAEHVLGIFMPEDDSDPVSTHLGQVLSEHLGIRAVLENIGGILRASGCYQRRDQFIRQLVPNYNANYKSKIVLPNIMENNGYNIFWLVVESPQGQRTKHRLPLEPYLGIVAATNMKQRTRKMMEYYHADRLNYAVCGTPNRLEFDQGFFVKNGDGAADFKPIVHLYKSQVYQLADALEIPQEIRTRPPTTDTYSLPQSQEEFYFALPCEQLDLCLYALNHNIEPEVVAAAIGISPEHADRVYQDIQAKRRATRYQHELPLMVEDVPEVSGCS